VGARPSLCPSLSSFCLDRSLALTVTQIWLTFVSSGQHDVPNHPLPRHHPALLHQVGGWYSLSNWSGCDGLAHSASVPASFFLFQKWLESRALHVPNSLQGWLWMGSDHRSEALAWDWNSEWIKWGQSQCLFPVVSSSRPSVAAALGQPPAPSASSLLQGSNSVPPHHCGPVSWCL
jgi:hypothetical protein